jgi:hypothetical protein
MPVVEGGTPVGVEIPLRSKYLYHVNGTQRSSPSGQAGPNKHRGETNKDRKAAAQAATRANMKTLVLVDGRRRSWRPYTP